MFPHFFLVSHGTAVFGFGVLTAWCAKGVFEKHLQLPVSTLNDLPCPAMAQTECHSQTLPATQCKRHPMPANSLAFDCLWVYAKCLTWHDFMQSFKPRATNCKSHRSLICRCTFHISITANWSNKFLTAVLNKTRTYDLWVFECADTTRHSLISFVSSTKTLNLRVSETLRDILSSNQCSRALGLR